MAESISSARVRELTTHSADETVAFGRDLARELRAPCLVLLVGDLGTGKTTLTKGIVAAAEEDVTSPSFTLVQEYGTSPRVYHADLYRIESVRELATLGFDDFLSANAIVVVEWGEKLWDNAPAPQFVIRMEHISSEERRITVECLETA
jgi:tRNA threonylcarbamoyladenosine biosynthesis protein TsaE